MKGEILAGRFELLERRGRGGMGTVYRALDRERGELVALKLAEARSPESGVRLAREAELLVRLSRHVGGASGIVRYVAHGRVADHLAFLATEWLDGPTLAEHLRSLGPLAPVDALALARGVAAALEVVHRAGIVHRDVKPSNLVLLDGDPRRVRLIDLGIAHHDHAARLETRVGLPIGTPIYMAPEQVRRDDTVTSATDVHGLGCVLFEALTGRPPVPVGTLLATWGRVLFEAPPRLSELVAGVPRALEDLVAALLDKDPDRRPPDGGAVVRAIDALDLEPPAERRRVIGPRKDAEQTMVCLVVADIAAEVGDETWPRDHASGAGLETVADLAARHHLRLEVVPGGPAVACVEPSLPLDAARRAAHFALALEASMPDAPVAIVTGRTRTDGAFIGPLVERALRLLRDREGDGSGVVVDEDSVHLLEREFRLLPLASGSLLASVRPTFHSRLLLGRPAPFVGRCRELALLESTFEAAVAERRVAVVVVVGAPGVGKTRLMERFVAGVRERCAEVNLLVGRGDMLAAGRAFGLVASVLRDAARIDAGEDEARRRAKLRRRCGHRDGESSDDASFAFLAHLAHLPPSAADASIIAEARQDPHHLHDRMRVAWVEWLARERRGGPTLLILEDLHWGDPFSIETVDAALRDRDAGPLMVLALARPDWRERSSRRPSAADHDDRVRGARVIELAGLEPRAREAMIRAVLDAPDEALVADLGAKSDGNPFFLEELLRAATDPHEAKKGWPETVLATVQARLMKLDPDARRALKAASTFGERFWSEGVAALVGGDAAAALARLRAAELVRPHAHDGPRGRSEWTFTHALSREAAYALMPETERVAGHLAAGQWLEASGFDEPVVLAEHYEHGHDATRAIPWYLRAVNEALDRHDLASVDALARRGLVAGATGETRGRFLLAQVAAYEWGNFDTRLERTAFAAMECFGEGSAGWFRALGALIRLDGTSGGTSELRRGCLDRLVAATPLDDEAAAARRMELVQAAAGQLFQGRYGRADRLLALAESDANGPLSPRLVGMIARARGQRALHAGDLAAALEHDRRGLAAYRRLGDLRSVCRALVAVGFELSELGDYAAALIHLEEADALVARLELAAWSGVVRHNSAYALLKVGRLEEALAVARRAVDDLVACGDRNCEGSGRIYLAEILLSAGRIEEAAEEGKRAAEVSRPFPPMWAFARAIEARILLAGDRAAEAHRAVREAVDLLDALEGVEQGESHIRLTHAEVLLALGDAEAAFGVIERAGERLLERAATIGDPHLRRCFLECVPENAATLALAPKLRAKLLSPTSTSRN